MDARKRRAVKSPASRLFGVGEYSAIPFFSVKLARADLAYVVVQELDTQVGSCAKIRFRASDSAHSRL